MMMCLGLLGGVRRRGEEKEKHFRILHREKRSSIKGNNYFLSPEMATLNPKANPNDSEAGRAHWTLKTFSCCSHPSTDDSNEEVWGREREVEAGEWSMVFAD